MPVMLEAPNVDRTYLVTFFCLLPYTTWILDVEFSVRLQMLSKKSGSIPESFGPNLELL